MTLVSMREYRFAKQHLRKVRHITLDPKGPGVIRLHMVPPKDTLNLDTPYIVIVNGYDLLPLNFSWAVSLACLMDALELKANKELSPEEWHTVVETAIGGVQKVYPGVPESMIRSELLGMLTDFIEIASGREPLHKVAPLSLGEYAPKMTAPHRMDLMVSAMTKNGSWNCNLKCLHCYAAGQTGSDEAELSTAQWLQILKQLQKAGVPQVTFTGGEPTLRKDLVQLVDAAQWFVTRLNTNGRLLTADLCAKLYEASLDSLQITLYSADEAAHNALVGANGFADTVAGIQNALAAGLSVSINTPLCSQNRNYLATLQFLRGLGVRYVTCSGLIPAGGALGEGSAATRLSAGELTDILSECVAYCHQNGMEIDFTSPGWVPAETLLSLGLAFAPSCGAALSNMAIGPSGNVLPCQSWLSGQPLGNLLTDDWNTIWNSAACAGIRAESAKMEHICQLNPAKQEANA